MNNDLTPRGRLAEELRERGPFDACPLCSWVVHAKSPRPLIQHLQQFHCISTPGAIEKIIDSLRPPPPPGGRPAPKPEREPLSAAQAKRAA